MAQWPAHTRMMTQGWAGAVGMAAWPAPARRRAALGVGDLRMELHSPYRPLLVADGRERRVATLGEHAKPGRQLKHAVAVAHPDRPPLLFRKTVE